MRLLLIGGSGLLGTEIQRQLKLLHPSVHVDAPTHKELDICNIKKIIPYVQRKYDKIMLLAGEKNQNVIEQDSYRALRTNIQGIGNVVESLQISDSPTQLVYVSTGYVYKGDKQYHKEDDGVLPCNKYAWSKLGGECIVRMLDEKQYLVIRCEFSKAPWHRSHAFIDQYTSREEIVITTYKMCALLLKNATGTFNIGGKRQSVYQYARSLDQGKKISKCKMKDFATVPLPYDSSLNTSKYNKFMEGVYGKTT
jgi:dTDP-4-dehydrorhamnose reductase